MKKLVILLVLFILVSLSVTAFSVKALLEKTGNIMTSYPFWGPQEKKCQQMWTNNYRCYQCGPPSCDYHLYEYGKWYVQRAYQNSDCSYQWVKVQLCQYGCSNNQCISCRNECISGQVRCNSKYKQLCGNYDADTCLEYPSSTSGTGNELCQYGCENGACRSAPTPICTNDCSQGDKKCNNNYLQSCNNYDSDSCLEWPLSTEGDGNILCEYGCENGKCSTQPLNITIINPINGSTVTANSTLLNIITNKNSVCEYSLCHSLIENSVGEAGCSKPKNMSVTGETLHSQLITGLKNTINNETQKEQYSISVNCADYSGNLDKELIIFYVNLTSLPPAGECIIDDDCTFGEECVNNKCVVEREAVTCLVDGACSDISLGSSLITGFNTILTDEDIPNLLDTVVSFQGKEYDISEKLVLSQVKNVTPQTSLSSQDDDYLTDIRLEIVGTAAVAYIYSFDKAINISKATEDGPLTINISGKKFEIINAQDNKFTALLGEKVELKIGESYMDPETGKNATLRNVGSSGSILIYIDGISETIDSGQIEIVSGLEIYNMYTFYDANNVDQRKATLVIGKDAIATYQDGDKYQYNDGICNNDPKDTDCWIWKLSGLGRMLNTNIISNASGISTTGPTIGIINDFTIDDDSDNPPKVGECMSFPNDYVNICFSALTIEDSDYRTYEIKYISSKDFSQAGGLGSASAIYLYSPYTNSFTLTNNERTGEIWIVYKSQTTKDVYYKDEYGQLVYAGEVTTSTSEPVANITKTNYEVNIGLMGTTNPYLIIKTPIDTLSLNLKVSEDNFVGFGETADTAEFCELMYDDGDRCIGTKDEDHKTKYGMIIRNPKNAFSNDAGGLTLEIPPGQVKAIINIYKKGASLVSPEPPESGGGGAPQVTRKSPETKKSLTRLQTFFKWFKDIFR